jgi:hypothetical protein
LSDQLFIAMHHQGKVSNIHHFKGGFSGRGVLCRHTLSAVLWFR